MRRLAAAALVAAATAALVAAAGAKHPISQPAAALVVIRNIRATSALGSYCTDAASHEVPDSVLCAEGAYPLRPQGKLPATPGAAVRVNLFRSAEKVTARLVRADGDSYEFVGPELKGQTSESSDRRWWHLRLPIDRHGADALSITMEAGKENANYWAAIRPVARWPRSGHGVVGRRPALVSTKHLRTYAAIGTHCLPSGGATGCADYGYPLDPRGHLPATPNARVRIDLAKKATSVTGTLVRPDEHGGEFVGPRLEASPLGARARDWRLRLPADLHGARALSLDVEYVDGDANYWAGLNPVKSWR